MDASDRFREWSLQTVFVSSDERHHLHPDAEPDVWRRGALLGSGGFGNVFEESCVDGPKRHQTRAVKQIQKSPDALRLVQRELDVLVNFATDENKHDSRDNFVRFLGWFGSNTHLYIAMELVPFGDLQRHISTEPCSEKETAVIVGQIGSALQYMHERNFVHRDLKPANILVARLGPDWHVKLTDFGISKNVDNTELQTQVGTEAYMAPELFDRTDVNTKFTSAVDVWSLGAVAFCVRTGKAPFANTYELCKFSSGTTRFSTQPLMRSSGAFVDFIFSLMEKSPACRPTMAEALEHEWVVSAGTVGGSNKGESPVLTRLDDEWEAQASAMWNTGVPSASQPNIRLDQTAPQLEHTIRPVSMSSQSLPIREGSPYSRYRNTVPRQLTRPVTVTRSPPLRQQRPNSEERLTWQTVENTRSSLTPRDLPYVDPILDAYRGGGQINARSIFKSPRPSHVRPSSPKRPAATSGRSLSRESRSARRWGTWTARTDTSPSSRSMSPAAHEMDHLPQQRGSSLDESGKPPHHDKRFDTRLMKPGWDIPEWLSRGHEVVVKVPYFDKSIRGLDSVIAEAGRRINNCMILKLDLHYRSASSGWKSVPDAGFARLGPSKANFIFEADGRDYQKIADDLECLALARAFALEFNDFAHLEPTIEFLVVPFVTMPFITGDNKDWFSLEDYNYSMSAVETYNDTHGFADDTRDGWNTAAQAFSHFTFERSSGQFLVCGLVGDRGFFSIPSVHAIVPECSEFSRNRGMEGFRDFFASHRCNSICRRLGLKSTENDLRNNSPQFRLNWPTQVSMTSCRNLLCGRTIAVPNARKSDMPLKRLWCDDCKPQLKLSEARRICPVPGPQHTFVANDFFYEVQGLAKPTTCRDHRGSEVVQEARDDSNPLD